MLNHISVERRKIVFLTVSILMILAFIMVAVPQVFAEISPEQADEMIHELEEIAHELEHIEEWMRIVAFSGIGIFLVLAGQLILQYLSFKKK
ncbi:hypothetical protein [Anoxynatronum buryatiense]|uniref:Uncharacterized protein n=1 Tax=Anoxynatronum buryatiense TaxID=489973 RepID=A0AA45WT85_9CLOT|nr:hypothetical protein [Anoxynatronum buryatiense]SMP40336.1 hypothetical protein SAMN06296020_101364 [Anoxynatronum buryatiense]